MHETHTAKAHDARGHYAKGTKRLVENSMPSGPHPSGGPDSLDAILLDPHGRELLERITRLYLVVHGRPPDPGGLRAYVGHLQAGKTLRDLAQEFIHSSEFTGKSAGR